LGKLAHTIGSSVESMCETAGAKLGELEHSVEEGFASIKAKVVGSDSEGKPSPAEKVAATASATEKEE